MCVIPGYQRHCGGRPAHLCKPGTAVAAQDRDVRPHAKVFAVAAAHIGHDSARGQALDELPHPVHDPQPPLVSQHPIMQLHSCTGPCECNHTGSCQWQHGCGLVVLTAPCSVLKLPKAKGPGAGYKDVKGATAATQLCTGNKAGHCQSQSTCRRHQQNVLGPDGKAR